jgi:hypothetical protein
MAKWDDSQKFTAETVRTIVLAVIGAIAAVIVLKPAENSVDYAAELDKTKLSIRSRVVDEFLTASYQYTAVAYDACGGDPEAMKKFRGGSVDAFRTARNRLVVYFDGGETFGSQLAAVDEATAALKELCISNVTPTAKDQWEVVRQRLRGADNDLAIAALKSLALFQSSR